MPATPLERGSDGVDTEPIVAPQIEAVGDVSQVSQDLRLGGEAFGPLPALLQSFVERVGIVHTFDVAARARVAVPVPGAAHVGSGLDRGHREARRGGPVHGVEPGEPGADDDDIADLGHDTALWCAGCSSWRRSAQTRCCADAAGGNAWIVMKPWNSPGKSRCTTGTPAWRNRRA